MFLTLWVELFRAVLAHLASQGPDKNMTLSRIFHATCGSLDSSGSFGGKPTCGLPSPFVKSLPGPCQGQKVHGTKPPTNPNKTNGVWSLPFPLSLPCFLPPSLPPFPSLPFPLSLSPSLPSFLPSFLPHRSGVGLPRGLLLPARLRQLPLPPAAGRLGLRLLRLRRRALGGRLRRGKWRVGFAVHRLSLSLEGFSPTQKGAEPPKETTHTWVQQALFWARSKEAKGRPWLEAGGGR